MLNKLVNLCNNRYQSNGCEDCSYGIHCPNNCETCLKYCHYPQIAPADRKYDCKRMADFYVCKYAHKYTSELIYAFSQLRDLQTKSHLNVLSIGCGPCTDLLALDYLANQGKYSFSTIDYRGVEINTDVWNNIYNDIINMKPWLWSFKTIPQDICNYIAVLLQQSWKPDLIVMQYVFSDMQKHTASQLINSMIHSLAQYIDSCDRNTYVVCNDINLTTNMGGGREYFDQLYCQLYPQATQHKYHFYNSNKQNHFEYGDEYRSNTLIIQPGNELDRYQPYKTCASAQMIIKI